MPAVYSWRSKDKEQCVGYCVQAQRGKTYCVNFHVVGLPSASTMIPAQGVRAAGFDAMHSDRVRC
jgi:hypothetical protein